MQSEMKNLTMLSEDSFLDQSLYQDLHQMLTVSNLG